MWRADIFILSDTILVWMLLCDKSLPGYVCGGRILLTSKEEHVLNCKFPLSMRNILSRGVGDNDHFARYCANGLPHQLPHLSLHCCWLQFWCCHSDILNKWCIVFWWLIYWTQHKDRVRIPGHLPGTSTRSIKTLIPWNKAVLCFVSVSIFTPLCQPINNPLGCECIDERTT